MKRQRVGARRAPRPTMHLDQRPEIPKRQKGKITRTFLVSKASTFECAAFRPGMHGDSRVLFGLKEVCVSGRAYLRIGSAERSLPSDTDWRVGLRSSRTQDPGRQAHTQRINADPRCHSCHRCHHRCCCCCYPCCCRYKPAAAAHLAEQPPPLFPELKRERGLAGWQDGRVTL